MLVMVSIGIPWFIAIVKRVQWEFEPLAKITRKGKRARRVDLC